ncbi:hypothetical protein [Sphingosinicella sp.]|uniref:hypothetical protein n=1 Tax=Sphingosinicella sp. TaxID=1917971 RepID=UPI00403785DC
MPYYRLYHLNRSSGHIQSVEEFHADDDVEGVAEAKSRQIEQAVELWQETRKVHRIEAAPDVAVAGAPVGLREAFSG